MKRFLAAAVVISLTILIVMLAARLLPTDSATAALKQRLQESLGVRLESPSEASLSLVPFPMLHIPDVSLTGPDGNRLVTSRGLTARLRLLPLLRGDIEPRSITLDAPDVIVAIRPDGGMSWPGIAQLAGAVTAKALPTIHLSRGTLAWQDLRDGSRIVLTDINGSISGNAKGRLGIDCDFVWRREKVTVDIDVAEITALGEGRWSDIEARFTAPPGRLRFFGRFNTIAGLQLDGEVAVDSPAADRLGVWLADDWNRSHWPAGVLDLRAQLKRVPEALSLLAVKLSLGETRATGAAALKMNDGRPLLQGTLAADTLDLSPLLKRLMSYGNNAGGWSRQDFKIASLSRFDTELRISAEELLFGKLTLENSALLADVHDSKMSLRLEEAGALGGTVAAMMRAAPGEKGYGLRLTFQGHKLALSQIWDLMGDSKAIEGTADIAADIGGTGVSTEAIAQNLNGAISFDAVNGTIHGINIAQQLQRLERSPLALGSLSGGRTAFARLHGGLDIAEGTGFLRDLQLESPELALAMAGKVNVAARTLQLAGTAARREKEPPFVLPFTVTGDWQSPVVRPDIDMLLRRSGAAAPLFPAIKAPTAQAPAAAQP
jgi:AsmA protein